MGPKKHYSTNAERIIGSLLNNDNKKKLDQKTIKENIH